jgi:hypothetical protein
MMLDGGIKGYCSRHPEARSDFIFANNIVMSASSGYAFFVPSSGKNTVMTVSNCDFYDLKRGVVFPLFSSRYFIFKDTLMRNPQFALTDEQAYANPDFMRPTSSALLSGGLSAAFTPEVDYFNNTRDEPITIGAVEGAQPVIKTLAKKALALIKNELSAPLEFKMYESYPNPFRQAATIRFQIPGTERLKTSINIVNLKGRVIKTLVNETKSPGFYTVSWDGRGKNNQAIPGGTYLCRLNTGKFHDVKRMVLIR